MKLGSSKAWAKTIGAGLANVQNGIDKLAEFGINQLKKAGDEPIEEPVKNKYAKKALKGARTVIGFLGELGDSYYDSYEELKRKQK